MTDSDSVINQLRVRFLTFREADAHERSQYVERLRRVPAAERVLLETCHRVELFSVDDQPHGGPCVSGEEAVRRIFAVIGGFDSAVIAEEQLLGQVRNAYEQALQQDWAGPVLNELVQRALRFGRRVRSHATPGSDRSLADRGVAWLRERIPAGSRVLVAGTGQMGQAAALQLAAAGHQVTLVSRSVERGREVVQALPGDGHHVRMGVLAARHLLGASGVVLAIRGGRPALTGEMLGADVPWMVDLSAPSVVSPQAAGRLSERLLTIDQLGAVEGYGRSLPPRVEQRLRRELDAQVEGFMAWLRTRSSADALAILHGQADAVRRRHLGRLRTRADLRPEQVEEVEAAMGSMLRELLHRPSVELRRGGADAETVRRLFGLDGP